MQAQLRSRLKDNLTVASLAGGRVDWNVRPQAKGFPAITLQIVSDPRPQHLGGNQAARGTLVQADVWSTSYPDAATLREVVIAELVPAETLDGVIFQRSFVEMIRETVERTDEGVIHRVSIDLMVNHTT
jgi:hypothetical protein